MSEIKIRLKRTTIYSSEFKLKAGKMYLEEGNRYKSVCNEFGIPDTKPSDFGLKTIMNMVLKGWKKYAGNPSPH